jgi:hypothetical protein
MVSWQQGLSQVSIRELFILFIFDYTTWEWKPHYQPPPVHKATPEHPLSKVAESKQICNARKKDRPIRHDFWFV